MGVLKQTIQKLRFIKLQRFIGSLTYPLQRDWIEHQSKGKHSLVAAEEAGIRDQIIPNSRGGQFLFGHLELHIHFLTPDFVRVEWKPGVSPVSYAIANQDWKEVETTFEETDQVSVISSQSLKVLVYPDGQLVFQNSEGQILREELPPQRSVYLSSRSRGKGEGWLHRARLRSEEHIYGLGERAAPLNLRTPSHTKKRARSYRMWNYDAGGKYGPGTDPLYLCIPIYLGVHDQGSYLVFYENTYPATFTFEERAIAAFEGGALRYYVAVGSPAQLLQRYSELTGYPPLPPRWVFGYHQSRWGYRTEKALRETAQGFLEHNLPVCAMHLDIDCLDGFRAFTVDPDRFPNIQEFTQELSERGIRLITIINPGVKASRNNRLFQEGREQDVFCKLPTGEPVIAPVWAGMCAFPDFTNPQARHWWSRQYEYLLDLGIAGFWHDMNEPAAFVLWGDPSLPPHSTQHCMEGRGGNHQEAHNVYGLLQARAGYERLREYQPEKRPFIVSRAGWAGIQRYAWTWTGDIETSWAGLRQTIPTVLNLSLSGMPYSGPDIGGFKGNPSPELYLRWFQLACFLPFFRTHSSESARHRTPWSFGEPTLSICREFLQLRHRLIPYFYTLAWEASQTGHPLVRPLFWADPSDASLWKIEDAFLLGDAVLVCPIVQAGTTDRSIALPAGQWYNFWNEELLKGAKQSRLEASQAQIPLLIKAGTILPMEMDGTLVLHLYPDADGSCIGQVYGDAGDGYGAGRVDYFELKPDQDYLELTWKPEGEYPFTYKSIQLHIHGVELQQVWAEGEAVDCQQNRVDIEQFQRLRLKTQPAFIYRDQPLSLPG